jgi:transposase-like protein
MKENESELNLVTLAQEYADEDKARILLQSILWPDGPVCPHCKNHKEKAIYRMQSKLESKTKVRNGLYKCGACRKTFTVTVGTVFEDSHLPINKWLMAISILCASKKSISALQLSRMLDITYKAAWFMNHRLRFAMSPKLPLAQLLKGIVEIDETYVGGVGDAKTKAIRKTPVVALIERGGNMRAKVVSNVTQRNLKTVIRETVDTSTVINTDDSGVYRRQLQDFKSHNVVNHSAFQYVLRTPDGGSAHVNTCESFFSLLKRGVAGAWHHVSREHLPKYADEFAFRWNTRNMTDSDRMKAAIGLTPGKRLTYRQAI